MDLISDATLLDLFTYLEADECFKARLVCKRWHSLISHRGVWVHRKFETCRCVDPCPGHQPPVKSYVFKCVPCCESIDMDPYSCIKYSSVAAQSTCQIKELKLELYSENVGDVTFILLQQSRIGYLQRLELQISYNRADKYDEIFSMRMNQLMMSLLRLSYTCQEMKILYCSSDIVPPLTPRFLSADFSLDLDLKVHNLRNFSFLS